MTPEQISGNEMKKVSFEAQLGYEIEDTELVLRASTEAIQNAKKHLEEKEKRLLSLQKEKQKIIEAAKNAHNYPKETVDLAHDESITPEQDSEWLKNFVPAELIREIETLENDIVKSRAGIETVTQEMEKLKKMNQVTVRTRRASQEGTSKHSLNN